MPDRTKLDVNETEERIQGRRPLAQEEEAREPWPEETTPPSRSERARSFFREHPGARLLLLLGLVVIIGAGVYVWHYFSIRETTDDAQIEGHIVPVSARVSGTVANVNVDDNQYVEKGAVLVQLDPTDYQVALERARAELADSEAAARGAQTGVPITTTTTSSQVSTSKANLAAAQRDVDAARARVREAEANYNKVSLDLKRMETLVARDEVSRQQYDATVAADQTAKATVDAAHAAVAAAESRVAQAESQLRASETGPQQVQVSQARAGSAQALVQKNRAAVQQAELNLQYATVRAPFAGIVSKKNVEPGQVVQAGQPLFSVVNLEDVWVVANFKENQLKDMGPGQPVTIHVDAFGRDYNGHLDSISGATGSRFSLLPPENATGNYVKVVQRVPVKIVFEKDQDPQHLLRPGMSVVPTVKLK